MRRSLAATAAVALVASLAITAARADGPTFTVTKAGPTSSEPGINVAGDGTIYVDTPSGLGAHSKLYKSSDSGASYQPVSFGAVGQRFPGGGDSDVITRGNRVYFLDLWAGSNSIQYSDDAGATWVAGQPFTTLPASDRQWLALGPHDTTTGFDTVYALYSEVPAGVAVARSSTNGLVWDSHHFISGSSGFTGQLLSDGNKTLFFTAEDGQTIRGYVSRDGGDTWTATPIASNVMSIIPGAAMDGQNVYAAWVDRTDYSTWVGTSHDLGATWTTQQVSAPDTSNIFAWVDARGGKVSVAWYGADAGAVKPDDVPASTRWMVRYSESIDGGGTFTTPVDVALARTQFICTRGLACDVNGPGHRELGDFLTTTIDNAGKSLIVFTAISGGSGVKVAKQN
jgi:hypothetical protein